MNHTNIAAALALSALASAGGVSVARAEPQSPDEPTPHDIERMRLAESERARKAIKRAKGMKHG